MNNMSWAGQLPSVTSAGSDRPALFAAKSFSSIVVIPSRDAREEICHIVAKQRGADSAFEALDPNIEIRGWFLSPGGQPVFGIRAISKDQVWVARRKQLRPEVLAEHPDRPDAINSGFSLNCCLRRGWNAIELQFKDADRKWHSFHRCQVRLPFFWQIVRLLARRADVSDYESWTHRHGDPGDDELSAMRDFLNQFPRRPLISVLMPVYNTPGRWLRRAIESVRAQVYPHWELCIADDCSPDPAVRKLLEHYQRRDSRIKISFRDENGHICESSNSALALCQGEFTALLDHDDELAPHALYHVAWELAKNPAANIIFSDEDKLDTDNVRAGPYFKPGWNYDLLLSQNCVSHLGAFRTQLMLDIGGFRRGLEGSQDWDLTLRALARIGFQGVHHIPRVLYKWRTLETSTASSMEAKPYAAVAGRRAVSEHLESAHPRAKLEDLANGAWRVIWPLPETLPRASIIIPTRNRPELLRVALDSLLKNTDYPDFEIVMVDHDSDDSDALDFLQQLAANESRVSHVKINGEFNWSAMNNLGVKHSSGEVLVFLNNDICITEKGWLTEMVRQALRPDVGAVGACLLYPNGTIQHAGVVLRMNGVAGHVFRHSPVDAASIGGPPFHAREVTAVTGACMAVRRENIERAGGFDEKELPISYNDIDFCLRLRSLGLRNIYTPHARLVHFESSTRGALEESSSRKSAATDEARVIMLRWPHEFEQDAFYNSNLSLQLELPMQSIPRTQWPWMNANVAKKLAESGSAPDCQCEK